MFERKGGIDPPREPRSCCRRILPPYRLGFRGCLIPGLAAAAVDVAVGCGRVSQLTNRLSLHAASLTPERFQAGPESTAWTAAFAHNSQARPARSLTGAWFDAAEFMFIAGLQICSSSLRLPALTERRRICFGLLWQFARAGLSPAGRLDLFWALELYKLCVSRVACRPIRATPWIREA
jgi:hypothetical protein